VRYRVRKQIPGVSLGMFLVTLLLLLAVASPAAAKYHDKPGFYVGAQGGVSYADREDGLRDLARSSGGHRIDRAGFAGRVFGGWNFNRNFSVEGGYTRFTNNEYRGGGTSIDVMLESFAWDAVGRLSLPIKRDSDWLLYVKAGVAEITGDLTGTITGTLVDEVEKTIEPTFGFGIARCLHQWIFEASYTQVQGKGDISGNTVLSDVVGFIPRQRFVAIGAIYKFDL